MSWSTYNQNNIIKVLSIIDVHNRIIMHWKCSPLCSRYLSSVIELINSLFFVSGFIFCKCIGLCYIMYAYMYVCVHACINVCVH